MNNLPTKLYTPEAVAALDHRAIKAGVPGFTLMRRAGQAVLDVLREQYCEANELLVLCGAGNNAGDGYIVARLAQQQGMTVKVVSLINPEDLKGDARQAFLQWIEIGEFSSLDKRLINSCDIIVDALLGTGISREVSNEWKAWIDAVNSSESSIVAVDVPSGLDALTGEIRGAAIYADTTVSFIGLKTGMFTASGKACCGDIVFKSLDIPDSVYTGVDSAAELLSRPNLPARLHDSHKGLHGHVIVVGGNHGMPGATILTARAALRSGAGLVSVVTRPDHISAVAAACPETMVHGSINGELPAILSSKISCIAIGPGLGQDAWAHRLLNESMKLEKPMVLDADALNLVTSKNIKLDTSHVITPHPGEAARLLSLSISEVQGDRYGVVRELHQVMRAIVVLKGSGTIVFDGEHVQVCPYGNPAMSVAGMGDALSGVIASLIAQGMPINLAAASGVCLHALAGDRAADGDDRGMLASDLIDQLRHICCE